MKKYIQVKYMNLLFRYNRIYSDKKLILLSQKILMIKLFKFSSLIGFCSENCKKSNLKMFMK